MTETTNVTATTDAPIAELCPKCGSEEVFVMLRGAHYVGKHCDECDHQWDTQ